MLDSYFTRSSIDIASVPSHPLTCQPIPPMNNALLHAYATAPVELLALLVACYRNQRALGLSHADARRIANEYLTQ